MPAYFANLANGLVILANVEDDTLREGLLRSASRAYRLAGREEDAEQAEHDTNPSAAAVIQDLAESLAEAGVTPLTGSDNPHEDTLGRALDLFPAARSAVERIVAMQAPEAEEERRRS